jgi:hypothetical protein
LDAVDDIELRALDVQVRFRPARNPHSGCYFLTGEQMAHWARQPHFLDRDISFIGPLESAATLGILQTFSIYKSAVEHAGFLEIQHYDTRFIGLIGNTIPLAEAVPDA